MEATQTLNGLTPDRNGIYDIPDQFPMYGALVRQNFAAISARLGNSAGIHVIATRPRDPDRPDYGLDSGGGEIQEAVLRTSPYTGNGVSVAVDGKEYDTNLNNCVEVAANGDLIIKKMEE